MISETKIDDSFPVSQFLRGGYATFYRLDRNSSGCGILVFIRTINKSYHQIVSSIGISFSGIGLTKIKFVLTL